MTLGDLHHTFSSFTYLLFCKASTAKIVGLLENAGVVEMELITDRIALLTFSLVFVKCLKSRI